MSISEVEGKVNIQILIVNILKSIATMKKEVDDIVYTVHNRYTLPYNYELFMESIDDIYKKTERLLDNIPL